MSKFEVTPEFKRDIIHVWGNMMVVAQTTMTEVRRQKLVGNDREKLILKALTVGSLAGMHCMSSSTPNSYIDGIKAMF